jgi:NDP-sugar pyrophosphorylase family protein
MILCAGLGTRLGALSDELPKPLLPMADIPIVRYGVALLVGHGIRDIVVNLHHMADAFERELGDGARLGARIRYTREPALLDTGGGVKNALALLDPDATDEPFVVMNGKLVIDADLAGLLAAHAAAGDVLGTMLVRRVPDAAAWGALDVDAGMRVRDFLGGGAHMFCGIHVTRASVVRRLPDGKACMIRQGYLPWIKAGVGEVAAFEHVGYFKEHSTAARYLDGNLRVVGGAGLRHLPGPVSGVDAAARIAPGARVVPPVRIAADAVVGAGATVGPDAVIGARARVAPGASVRRAVVWQESTAEGTVEDAIVTPRGVVRVEQDDPLATS